MKKSVLPLATLAVALAACRSDDPVAPSSARLPSATAAVQASAGGRSVVEFNGPVRKDFAATIASLGGTVDFIVDHGGFAAVSGLSASAVAQLARMPGIASVYDDLIVQLEKPVFFGSFGGEVSAQSPSNPLAAAALALQWNMFAVHAPEAWQAGNLGSSSVTAAILDTGIDYDNLDFNGLVDLSRSVSFVPSDDQILDALFPTRNKIDDLGGHGTLVATQASSNAVAFAGVSSKTRLMGVKVLGATGNGTLSGILGGLIWAADHGADVANMSLGISGGIDKAGNGAFVGLMNHVFNYANAAGMVVVVAAGNDAMNLDNDGRTLAVVCEAPHVICVSATGPTSGMPFQGPWGNVDAFADYSDFGRQAIAVAAPGGSAFGFVSGLCAKHWVNVVGNTLQFPCANGLFILGGAGTSAAAPHVTGLIAQLIAKYGKGRPAQIKQLLLNGVDDLGPPGADPQYGAGRINVLKALSQ